MDSRRTEGETSMDILIIMAIVAFFITAMPHISFIPKKGTSEEQINSKN